jgi:hypothetical protein
LVAHELRSGRRHRLFFNPGQRYASPLPYNQTLYVAYAAHAEWSTFLALGWQLPVDVLDLYAEFKARRNGLVDYEGRPLRSSLLDALEHFGLDGMAAAEKKGMRDLILRGHPFTDQEERAIIDYCEKDVIALEKLLPALLPEIDLPYAVFHGRYSKAVGRIEYSGIPSDAEAHAQILENWDSLKERLAADVERENGYGVFEGTTFKMAGLEAYLDRKGWRDDWPTTPTGHPMLDDDGAFKDMAALHPQLEPLREVRNLLQKLRTFKIAVGSDGRSRFPIMPFGTITGRNAPPASKFVFGPSAWVRSLIKPEEGRGVAYIDWSSAEFGIAAALSGDEAMQAAYESGDVYLATAKQVGYVPPGATKKTHPRERDLFKIVTLATQYGQKAAGLARRTGIPLWKAEDLLASHRRAYPAYWDWVEYTQQIAMFDGRIETVFGWPLNVSQSTGRNTIMNFPVQANGAEMLRWACCFAVEAGIEVHAPVHDALLVGGPADCIIDIVEETRKCMQRASELVLDGYVIRTDSAEAMLKESPSQIVCWPDRYFSEKGVTMWNKVQKILNSIKEGCSASDAEVLVVSGVEEEK